MNLLTFFVSSTNSIFLTGLIIQLKMLTKLLNIEPLAKLLKGEHDYTDFRIFRINI